MFPKKLKKAFLFFYYLWYNNNGDDMKKAFTLVELLAVITIIGVLSLIIIPNVNNIIKDSKNKTYEIQLDLILTNLENWAADNIFSLPSNEGEYVTITLGELKTKGYSDIEIRNPKNDMCFSNEMVLKVTKKNNKYDYSVVEDTIDFFDSETCEVE